LLAPDRNVAAPAGWIIECRFAVISQIPLE